MENLKEILEQTLKDGYYIMPDKSKAILDFKIYKEEKEEIFGKEFPDYFTSLTFAVFRATIYNWGFGKDLMTDYSIYEKFMIHRELNTLQSNTIKFPELIEISSNDDYLRDKFTNDINDPKKPFIINSFHYSSYKSMLNYLLYNNLNVFLIATKRIIDEHQKNSEFYSLAINHIHDKKSKVTFIDAEDPKSLLTLAESCKPTKNNNRNVVLIFPDGNMGARKEIDIKRFEHIDFLGRKLLVRKGVLMFAELFNIPIYNTIINNTPDNRTFIEVENYIENPKEQSKSGENILKLFYRVLEERLKKDSFYKWECWMYIHSWMERLVPSKEGELVTEKNYDNNRFSLITIKDDKYIFDSKYYLSYLTKGADTVSLKELVLSTKITL
jgi:hypothetical protein